MKELVKSALNATTLASIIYTSYYLQIVRLKAIIPFSNGFLFLRKLFLLVKKNLAETVISIFLPRVLELCRTDASQKTKMKPLEQSEFLRRNDSLSCGGGVVRTKTHGNLLQSRRFSVRK